MSTSIKWNGSMECYLDQVHVNQCGVFAIGNFGGCKASGAFTNEDGLFCLESSHWRFAALMDAHATYESVLLVSEYLENCVSEIESICNEPIEMAIPKIQTLILKMLMNETAMNQARQVKGETAVLVCFEKEGYLWWLSIGDNSLYVFQKEFNELGQYKLNQRIFYQWFGQENSLALRVPCYSSGTIHLREGEATILMLTDGVLEIEGRPYENESLLESVFSHGALNRSIEQILEQVKTSKGRDSATLISWRTHSKNCVLRPTRL